METGREVVIMTRAHGDIEESGIVQRIVHLESTLRAIEDRNRRVEEDKAWETSRLRVLAVVVVTYIVTAIVFGLFHISERYLIDALIPTVAFFLSTRTLSILKRWWITRYFRTSRSWVT